MKLPPSGAAGRVTVPRAITPERVFTATTACPPGFSAASLNVTEAFRVVAEPVRHGADTPVGDVIGVLLDLRRHLDRDRAPDKIFGVAVFIDGRRVGDGGVPRDGREIDRCIGDELHGEAVLRTRHVGIGGLHGGRHGEIGGDGSGALECRR